MTPQVVVFRPSADMAEVERTQSSLGPQGGGTHIFFCMGMCR